MNNWFLLEREKTLINMDDVRQISLLQNSVALVFKDGSCFKLHGEIEEVFNNLIKILLKIKE